MPEREYHAHPAVNASGLKRILQSPAHYKLHLEPSDAMDLGSAVHTEVLGVNKSLVYMPSDVVSIDPRGRCFDWCAECCRSGECLLDLADDAADDLLTTHWKGEL